MFCALAGLSLPSFFFAAVLRRVFSIGLGWLPLSGMVTAKQNFTGLAHIADMGMHFILPIVVFVILGVGSWLRYVRTNMLEVLNADYVRTARAKGLSEHKVIYKHAFRNTLIPIVTFIGGSIPGLFSGAIITESIFSIDGIGKAAIDAVHTLSLIHICLRSTRPDVEQPGIMCWNCWIWSRFGYIRIGSERNWNGLWAPEASQRRNGIWSARSRFRNLRTARSAQGWSLRQNKGSCIGKNSL